MEPSVVKQNLYDILGVATTASKDDIKTAYRKLALKHHPDKPNGNRQEFEKIHIAYSILRDPQLKDQYDKTLVTRQDGTESESSSLDEWIALMMDLLRAQFKMGIGKQHAKRQKQCDDKNNTQYYDDTKYDVMLNIDVELAEVYRGDIKKVVARVKRGGQWDRVTCLINLLEYNSAYVFKKQGDEQKGDIIINVRIKDPPANIKVINHDLHIYGTPINLYTFLYGGYVHVNVLGVEDVDIPVHPLTFQSVLEGYGLSSSATRPSGESPQNDAPTDESSSSFGDLHVHFRLDIKWETLSLENVRAFIKAHFSNASSNELSN